MDKNNIEFIEKHNVLPMLLNHAVKYTYPRATQEGGAIEIIKKDLEEYISLLVQYLKEKQLRLKGAEKKLKSMQIGLTITTQSTKQESIRFIKFTDLIKIFTAINRDEYKNFRELLIKEQSYVFQLLGDVGVSVDMLRDKENEGLFLTSSLKAFNNCCDLYSFFYDIEDSIDFAHKLSPEKKENFLSSFADILVKSTTLNLFDIKLENIVIDKDSYKLKIIDLFVPLEAKKYWNLETKKLSNNIDCLSNLQNLKELKIFENKKDITMTDVISELFARGSMIYGCNKNIYLLETGDLKHRLDGSTSTSLHSITVMYKNELEKYVLENLSKFVPTLLSKLETIEKDPRTKLFDIEKTILKKSINWTEKIINIIMHNKDISNLSLKPEEEKTLKKLSKALQECEYNEMSLEMQKEKENFKKMAIQKEKERIENKEKERRISLALQEEKLRREQEKITQREEIKKPEDEKLKEEIEKNKKVAQNERFLNTLENLDLCAEIKNEIIKIKIKKSWLEERKLILNKNTPDFKFKKPILLESFNKEEEEYKEVLSQLCNSINAKYSIISGTTNRMSSVEKGEEPEKECEYLDDIKTPDKNVSYNERLSTPRKTSFVEKEKEREEKTSKEKSDMQQYLE